MTVILNDVAARNDYVATAGQTVFPLSFKFFAAGDLLVYQNGVLKTLSTHYTVQGAAADTGMQITLVSGAALSDTIAIIRAVPYDRTINLPITGPFPIASLNTFLAKTVAMIQQLRDENRRQLTISQAEATGSFNALPAPAARAGMLLGFDADGQPITTLAAAAASATPFTQSGANAVTRMVDAKLNEIVSPEDFGAVGDGVADDTVAIQRALNASSKVSLRPGKTYKITSALTTPFEGQCVIGGGRHAETAGGPIGGTTIKQMSSVDIFTVTKPGFTLSDVNLTYGVTPTAGACVNSSASNTSISRVYAGGPCFDAFKFTTGGTGHSLSDFYLGGMANSGVYVQGTNDVAISDGVMAVHNAVDCPNGVVVFDGYVQAVNMSNVDILSGAYSIGCVNIGAGVSSRASFCSFSNVYFDSSAGGAKLDGMFGCVFTNCWFSNRPGPGLVIGLASAAEGNSFVNCRFTNCGSHGAALYANAKWTTFEACQFVANGQASSGHGIYIAPNTTRFYVRGCISYNGEGLTAAQQYGIYIDTGTSNFYEITHNDLQNNVAGTMVDGGSGSSKHVHANLGYNAPASVVTPTVGASPYTYSNTKGTPQLVVITGGTVSAITLFGVTVYTVTGHHVVLPPGQGTTITYSSAPTVRVTDLF